LRSAYFQRAIRAITTGHSNRRRTQEEDFEDLRIFLPDLPTQQRIGAAVKTFEDRVGDSSGNLRRTLSLLDQVILGKLRAEDFVRLIEKGIPQSRVEAEPEPEASDPEGDSSSSDEDDSTR